MQDQINNLSMLKVGTILHGTYRIDSYLSSGGFGNTYVATNVEFEEKVAIKEFFMKGVTQRDDNQTTVSVSNAENHNSFLEQKEKFKKEARRIRQLKNKHIVSVHDLFEENGTAYYVMDYVDGENLAERLKRTGKPMSEQEVSDILPQILDALKSVHDAGIWHLDLKPANIMIDKAGKVKLIDFGASKQLNAQKGGATTSTAISYTNGYAPREQMEQNYDKFGPWTDIYALGATLYNLLTNKRPPLPSDIDDDETDDKHLSLPFPTVISDDMKDLVLQIMHTNRKQRPQNIGEVLTISDLRSLKSNDSINDSIAHNINDFEDCEVTIMETSKKEESIVVQKNEVESEPNNSSTYVTVQEQTEKTNNSRNLIYFLTAIFLLGLVIWGYRSYVSSVQEPVAQESESNQPKSVDRMQYGLFQYSGPVDDKNRPNGIGEAFFDNGDYYKGFFVAGTMYGTDCLYRYENGDEYKGGFTNGSFSYGRLTRAEDGSFFVGSFKDDWPNEGTWYSKDGKVFMHLDQSMKAY